MQGSNETTSGTAAGASGAFPADTLAALEQLHRLLEQVSIYPPGHPVVELTRDEAVAQIRRSLETRSPLEIQVDPESISVDARVPDSVRCRLLGKVLFSLDISSIQLREGVQPEEILTLVEEVAHLRAGNPGPPPSDSFDAARFPNVRVAVVDYGALRFEQGAQDRALSDDPEVLWRTLSQTILGESGSGESLTPESLGVRLGDEIARLEDVGSGTLARELRRVARGVENLDADARRNAEVRMERMLTSLPDSLRKDLLRIEARASAIRESPFAGHLRSAAVTTTTSSLLAAVERGERPPQDALALVNQLLRLGTIGPDQRESLENIVGKAEERALDREDLSRIARSVGEIFHNRDDLEVNVAEYQDLIDCLAVGGVAPSAGGPSTWRAHFADPADADSVRVHALEIAIAQLEDGGSAVGEAEALSYLSAATDWLLDGRRFDVLVHALDAVFRRGASAAAAAYLADVTSPARVDRILELLRGSERVPDAAAELLRRAGPPALEVIMRELAKGAPPAVAASFHEIILTYPTNALLTFAEQQIREGWSSARHVFPVLQCVPDPEVTRFLGRLLEDREELIRCEALSALLARQPPADVLERALVVALGDENQQVVRIALRALQFCPTEACVETIGLLIEGRLSRSTPGGTSLRLHAVRSLTKEGRVAWTRVLAALDRLAWSGRKSDGIVARRIVDEIRQQFDASAARRLLRRWRWSLGRLLSSLRGRPS